MINQNIIPRETREFFDLKNKLVEEIENYEKKVFSEKENLEQIQKTFDRLWEMFDKNDSEYFRLRLDTLDKLLKRNIEKRAYKKIEFDRMFKVLDKIKQNDSVEFLNEAIKNRIEKISEKIVRSKQKIKAPQKDTFYLLTYKSLSFLVRNYPKKILYDVDATKDFVKIKRERYPIFPAYTGIKNKDKDFQLEYCNILILKVRTEYKCLRFDEMESVNDLTYVSLNTKLIPLTEPMQDVKHYIRIRGKRVYYLDL
ncbi:MAG: hypothetical protein KBF93_16865 [Leptospiraceae bacterium]|nr:hypothetical protein [Leptospiraceae bacterium]